MLLLVSGALAFTSCVPKKKYLGSQNSLKASENEKRNVQQDLNACRADVTSLESERDRLKSQNVNMQDQNADMKDQNQAAQAEAARKLKVLQDRINAQKDLANRLKMSISDALMGFKPDELSVYLKDGNVYVSLEEKLLFPSGSAVLNPAGKEAIGKLAAVLTKTPEIYVQILGHTDNVPIKTERYSDNWDLSTARATSIVRVFTTGNGMDPLRITASGRGEFHPVKSNETAEGRASNRRTEIILSPDLTELYKMME